MVKKNINQNDILNMELLNAPNPSYIFNKSPINRYKIKKNTELASADLKNLKNTIDTIHDCELKKNALQVVFGSGSINAELMIIGGGQIYEQSLQLSTKI